LNSIVEVDMKIVYVATAVNPTQEALPLPNGDLLPGTSRDIFFDLDTFRHPFPWLDAIASGLVFKDFTGAELDPLDAYPAIQKLQKAAGESGVTLSDRALWNLEVAKYLLAAVRAETLDTDLSALGTTWQAVVAKFQSITGLVMLGMLNEARSALLVVPVDGFLTTARLTRWANFCHSADALN
jgi:hypothetical protein